jgi:hypothetical protein
MVFSLVPSQSSQIATGRQTMAMDLRLKQQETNVCIHVCICIYIYTYIIIVYIYIGKPIYIYVIQYTHMGNVSKQRVYVYPPKSLWFPALEFSSAVSGKLARELG